MLDGAFIETTYSQPLLDGAFIETTYMLSADSFTGVRVILNDGRTFCGPVWEWRPKEGWFTLVMGDAEWARLGAARFRLSECYIAIDRQQRTNRFALEDVDLLARAWEEGWDGR